MEIIGADLARTLERKTLMLYAEASAYAAARGIILADTKFEFGYIDGELALIDELLTPDSSRFWDVGTYEPGRPQASMDKQPLRDWLEASGWNKQPPAPDLPPEVIEATQARYLRAYERLTGRRRRYSPLIAEERGQGVRMPRWQAGVTVMLKPVVNDPQGLAVESGLQQLGYRGVSQVRVGKYIELALVAQDELDARNQIEAMCDKLLANPVIEDYAYVVDEAYEDADDTEEEALDTEAW